MGLSLFCVRTRVSNVSEVLLETRLSNYGFAIQAVSLFSNNLITEIVVFTRRYYHCFVKSILALEASMTIKLKAHYNVYLYYD